MEEVVRRIKKARTIRPIEHGEVKISAEEEREIRNLAVRSFDRPSNNSSYRWEGLAYGGRYKIQ